MSNTKKLPKSLHTVTALARLAAYLKGENAFDNETAVHVALDVLGYNGAPDPYELAARAVAVLESGK